MENKYYTPDISEFHVGFEFDIKPDPSLGLDWVEGMCFSAITLHEELRRRGAVGTNLEEYYKDFPAPEYRVKYLDQEDIESLGFEKSVVMIGSFINYTEFVGIQLWQGEVVIYNKFGLFDRQEQVFKGTIKNKSELKVVLKMIGYDNK